MSRKHLFLFLVLAAILLVSMISKLNKRSARLVRFDSGHHQVMGTFVRVVCVARDLKTAKKCVEAAFTEFESVDAQMSDYKTDSELSMLNRQGYGAGFKVSPELFEVLQRAQEFSKLSQGAFDVTVGALVDLWRNKKDSLPNEKELAEAHRKVGYEKLKLELETRSVRFDVEGMRLDLGGIAKGYAIDRAVEKMKNKNAVGGLVDIGGDIRCFGKADDKEHWVIGLQDPKNADENSEAKSSMTLKLTDNAIATSGDYRRYVSVKGKRYSHIIDARKGYSSRGLSSVTIIGVNALDVDALATAVSVLGAKTGLQLVESMEGIEAILFTSAPEYKLIKSKNADKYILQK